VQQYPTVADLVVSPQRVEVSTSWNWNPFAAKYPLEQRKHNLIGQLLKEKGADVLVEPTFVTSAKGIFGRRTLQVSGYLAKLKDFRQASDDDIQALAVAHGIPSVRLVSARNVPQPRNTDADTSAKPVVTAPAVDNSSYEDETETTVRTRPRVKKTVKKRTTTVKRTASKAKAKTARTAKKRK
jgi:hypothetical protein